MTKLKALLKTLTSRNTRDFLLAVSPTLIVVISVLVLAHKYVDPAPPRKIVISTGDEEGDYQEYAKLYKDFLKENGIELIIKSSTGPLENLRRLRDEKSDVEVAFMQDGLGSSEDVDDLSSLGSLYYEPVWVFYRGQKTISRFVDFKGLKVAIGRDGEATQVLVKRLLEAAKIDGADAHFVSLGGEAAADALHKGQVDAAIFVRTPEDALIRALAEDSSLHLMNFDQAEAITRQNRFLHHLVLPHGTFDLARGIPAQDINLVAPTATLLVRDSIHPALSYLLLRAAAQVHSEPGIFEARNEFPQNKDDQFALSDEARDFYKSGTPFWQKYLPFWLASLFERLILVVLPAMALIIPLARSIPKIMASRVRSRILKYYGQLRFIETQISHDASLEHRREFAKQIEGIERAVHAMHMPLDFMDHIYVLREHIDFVRRRLTS